jgi:putative peptidoglycan lipid II flippase
MIRPLATVSAGTLGSRLTGFLRDALIAALFGAGFVADAFLFAFQLVNVARRLLSEGALNAMLVPAYARIRADAGTAAATAFAGRTLGTIGLAVFLAAIVLGAVAPYVIAPLAPAFAEQPSFQLAVDTLRLMLPYLAFAGPIAVMAGVLNANGRVGLTAFSPVLFNAVMIIAVAALLLTSLPAQPSALALAAVVGSAGCLQLIFLGVSGTRYTKPVRLSLDGEIQKVFRRALPGMVAQSGSQLFFAAGAVIASAQPSAVAFLYFASRLIDLPLGLVGTATGAVLIPRLSRAASGESTTSSALQLTLGLALPAAVGLAQLAGPITALLFEHGAFTAADTAATADTLTILAFSLPAFALARPISAVFFARETMTHPLVATLAGLATTIVAALVAQPRYGHAGVAAAISLGAWVTASWLAMVLAARNELAIDATAWRNAAFIVAASAIMAAAIQAALTIAPVADGDILSRAIALGTLIALGVLVYAACLRLFGVVKFRVIRRAF